jgi:hypothetical protein
MAFVRAIRKEFWLRRGCAWISADSGTRIYLISRHFGLRPGGPRFCNPGRSLSPSSSSTADVHSPVMTGNQEVTMNTGLHAVGWGLQRLALALVATAFGLVLAYALLVFVIVAVQGVASFGQQ